VLSAAGFDVAIPDAIGAAFSTRRPDIVLIDLTDLEHDAYQRATNFVRDLSDEAPIVALVLEVGRWSCERARRAGCAAVCLATCSAEILSAGLRAVLERFRGQAGCAQI
jgi:AmiR/NasT family two-component response regulator